MHIPTIKTDQWIQIGFVLLSRYLTPRREWFHQRVTGRQLEPFTLTQVGISFVIFALGLAFAFLAFLRERFESKFQDLLSKTKEKEMKKDFSKTKKKKKRLLNKINKTRNKSPKCSLHKKSVNIY